ncbi:MAG: bifunctional 2-C-methyl-D-erythritol 4-phosphate cytidylyltransferase/2-C-methyl-D-erythritol 2,4-cyclodiphosphate synthase [Alphaproteobacteria bacterium CG11_big_fil_rev_8_21_14_0_20_39_49]|nr:MAG: bifunctional 2-C-methyl-D-erythritol 4-phosphate cytidylyltransferase/2-C-methyl-D-erythritol 2,4-cyclodiphosphate synthase [Alphaproteobacteria bacterium CG11_big_fil_rev_8_21_14_0_20_39_49]
MNKLKTYCLIVAAGHGTRTGSTTPKQYMNLHGMPMLRHTVLVFLNNPNIDGVLVVYNPNHKDLYDFAVGDLEVLAPASGGITRQESVRHGLEALKEYKPHKVLIHDAARPLVSDRIINAVIDAVSENIAVIPAVAVEDTLKKCENGKVTGTIDRTQIIRTQTPQGFIYKEILNCHNEAKGRNFTDDAAIKEYLGENVITVDGSQLNFKITTKEDFERAERIMSMKHKTKVGLGFDVHRFCEPKSEADKIMLCGVAVEHDKSLEGHSDADVGIHAVVDAILGAISEGDIGEHFPPSDDKYKGVSSDMFLEHACSLVAKKHGVINNIDITIICESPKISKYKKDMEKRIAQIAGIDYTNVNVKATTTEKLGFTGRGEGIAAQAVVSVDMH